jgi:hypothetical protein
MGDWDWLAFYFGGMVGAALAVIIRLLLWGWKRWRWGRLVAQKDRRERLTMFEDKRAHVPGRRVRVRLPPVSENEQK